MSLETDRIINGDCMDVMSEFPEESIHAVVCDPPYGLNFMPDVTNGWDDFEPKEYQEFCEEWAKEVKRVLKPGGHLLAFSGNRTHHRLFTGVEDTGFEIRDTLTWHYGSGFPKASDISKTIDKREGAERETKPYVSPSGNEMGRGEDYTTYGEPAETEQLTTSEPATDSAKQWDGWKTGLKPATEYIVMARKPFDGATVDCVLEHGTGALNIDSCRVEHENGGWTREGPKDDITGGSFGDQENDETYMPKGGVTSGADNGRYPSNVVFDETESERLDALEEHTEGGRGNTNAGLTGDKYGEQTDSRIETPTYDDHGGPSRYFYTSKASKSERTENGKIENSHPTVKPQDLMEWLVKLVTKENQLVVDPFCGSGTTLKACKSLNRDFIGIEKQPKWADVARVRVGLTPKDPSVVRSNDNQSGLEVFE